MTATVDEYRAAAARAMSEDDLQSAIVKMAYDLGYLVYHARSARSLKGWRTALIGHIGWPDLVLARGAINYPPERAARFIIAELKSNRGHVSEHQQLWLDVLGDCGLEVYVWAPRDLVSGEITAVLTGERRTT